MPSQRQPDTFGYGGYRTDEGPFEEWNPTEESLSSARGRHRVARQKGGGLARSSTVLGVGVIAAVGAGGMASANTGKPPVSISLPDLPTSVSSLLGEGTGHQATQTALSSVTTTTATDADSSSSDAGEALRSRIIAQAAQQQNQLDTKASAKAVAAADKAVADAEAKAEKAAAATAPAPKENAAGAAQHK
ncbi:hypothetical protein ACFV23_44340 [Streptomyces sp. NPDC059627]